MGPRLLQGGHRGLRRLMCNGLDPKVRQVAQWSTKPVVEPLPTGVGRHLGGHSRQQPLKGLGPVAFEAKKVLELADHPLDDLTFARCPATVHLRPCPTLP